MVFTSQYSLLRDSSPSFPNKQQPKPHPQTRTCCPEGTEHSAVLVNPNYKLLLRSLIPDYANTAAKQFLLFLLKHNKQQTTNNEQQSTNNKSTQKTPITLLLRPLRDQRSPIMKINVSPLHPPESDDQVRQSEAWAEDSREGRSCGKVERDTDDEANPIEGSEEIPRVAEPLDNKKKATITLQVQENTRLIERRKTVLTALVKNQTIVNMISRFYKVKFVQIITTAIWFVCTVSSLYICFGKLLLSSHIYPPMQVFCTLNFYLNHSIFLRIDIIQKLVRSFNFWFSFINALSSLTCFIILWGESLDVYCAAIQMISSLVLMILYDTHAGKKNKFMIFSTLVGSISFIPGVVILLFGLVDFENEKIYLKHRKVELINIRLQALDNLTTVIMYLLRIFYTQKVVRKSSTVTFISEFYEIVTSTPPVDERSNRIMSHLIDIKERTSVSPYPDRPDRGMVMDSVLPIYDENMSMSTVAQTEKNQRKEGTECDDSQIKPASSRGMNNETHKGESSRHNGTHKGRSDGPIDSDKYLLMGIMETKTIEYDPHQTLFHTVVVYKLPTLSNVMKSRYYSAIGVLPSIQSSILSFPLAAGFDLGHIFFIYGVSTTLVSLLFIISQIIFMSNFMMLRYMIRSFDFWYVLFTVSKVFISSGILCGWDTRMIFWASSILQVYWFMMIDNFRIKNRKWSYLSLIGLLWAYGIIGLCKLNIGKTFSHDQSVSVNEQPILSPKMMLSSSLFSASIFLIRFLWSYHKNPNRILFMTENVRVEPIQNH